jgi:hypothetical protein
VTDLHASPEIESIIAFFESTGVPGRVTSTYRPGAMTASGNPSRHGRKLAVDFAGLKPSRDSEVLAAIFNAFFPVEAHLAELIYAGPQVTHNIKTGRRRPKYAQELHHDHVHVAVDPGVDLRLVAPKHAPTTNEKVSDTDGRELLVAEPVDAMCSPQGGVWVLTRDGGVRTYDHADPPTPFYGSYFSLDEKHRNIPRTFVQIKTNDRGGYDIVASSGEVYSFP